MDRHVIINSFYDNIPSRTTSKFGINRRTKSQPKARNLLKTPERSEKAKEASKAKLNTTSNVLNFKKRVNTTSPLNRKSPMNRKLNFRERATSRIDTGLKGTKKKN